MNNSLSCILLMYLIRHGERVDKVNPNWKLTAKNPDDPPLTYMGKKQGYLTGRFLKNVTCPKE